MIVYTDVHSSTYPDPMVILATKVLINTDVVESQIEREEGTETDYCFTQTEYSKDEFIAKLSQENDELNEQLTDTQMALCELYEGLI